MGSRMVFLNGPPSAGTSSVGRALRQRLEGPFLYSDLDDFATGYPPRWWDDRFDALWDRVVDGWLLSLRGLALAGNDVIAATMILPGTAVTHFRLFSEFTVYLVAIRCPIEVAQDREFRRSHRRRR